MNTPLKNLFLSVSCFCLFIFQSNSAFATPDWYDGSRVHIHTRYPITRINEPGFWNFATEVERMGPGVMTRWIKGTEENAWWPTIVGQEHSLVSVHGDIAQTLIDDAHQHGRKIIAYHRHQEDTWATQNHPDWVALNRDGSQAVTTRLIPGSTTKYTPWMSLASPYSDYYIERTRELARRGVDGIYIDWVHIPSTGDFSSHAQSLYSQLYGGNIFSATDAQIEKFRQAIQANVFKRVTTAFKEINPDGVILLSVNRVALDGLRNVTAPKYEVSFNDYLGGLESAATILTDVGGGFPHLWRGPETVDSNYTIARYLTYGTIYNRDIREGQEGDIPQNLFPEYAWLFDLNNKISPAMTNVRPYRQVKVAVNGNLVVRVNNLPESISNAWNALNNAGISTGYVSYKQLCDNELDADTEVVVVPAYSRSELINSTSPGLRDMVVKLDEFVQKGGKVFYRSRVLNGTYLTTIKNLPHPVELTGGNSSASMVPYLNNNSNGLVVNIVANNVSGMSINLSNSYFSAPVSVTETVSGQILTPVNTNNGWTIALPLVQAMAQLNIEFGPRAIMPRQR